MTNRKTLLSLRPQLAAVAQAVYDVWDEEDVDTYAGGGICHLIADAMCVVLDAAGFNCASVSQSIGDVHVFAVAQADDGVYIVDIPPYIYEKGGGYNWTRLADVEFDERDVLIERASNDPADFDDYLED